MWRWPRDNWSLGLILFVAVWWWPWWLFILIWFIGVLLLPRFYQALLSTFIFDLLHSSTISGPWQVSFPLTIATLILIWLGSELQYRLRL